MSTTKYIEIAKHYESCVNKHGDSHLGVDWPREYDTNTRHEAMLGVLKNDVSKEIELLDLGCGLSHMMDYMIKKGFDRIRYSGLDITPKFVELSKTKYPQNKYYCLDILEDASALPDFDYIVMNGVFTQKVSLKFDEMFLFLKKITSRAFEKAKKGIAFNVMSKQVDFERDGSFHVPFDIMAAFIAKELSRKFVFNHGYGLYEYTSYVYR